MAREDGADVGDEAPAPPSARDQRTGRFLPGVSGNPGGRPIQEPGVVDLARSAGALALLTLMKVCNDRTAPHTIQMRAADLLLRRGFGKPPAPVPGGVGRWPGLRENVQRCLDSFVREEGSDAIAGAPPACDLQHGAASPAPTPAPLHPDDRAALRAALSLRGLDRRD